MKRLRLFIRAFFGFTRMETNAFLLLIPLIFMILFSEPAYHHFIEYRTPLDIDRTDSLLAWIEAQERLAPVVKSDTLAMHRFDPNISSEKELVSLQLSRSLASRMVRYREKGGKFHKKEDVLRIYGMDTAWYRRAKPFMMITSTQQDKPKTASKSKREKSRDDINTADTTQLINVYGIGPVLAKRIITFRDRLGGFVAFEQLREVYGLDSAVIKRLEIQFEVRSGFSPRVLLLNEVTLEELMRHPYISRKQAQAILAYRSQHGKLDSLGQLRGVKLIDEKWLEKIRPYLGGLP